MSAPGEDDLDPDVLEELEAWSGPEDDEDGADRTHPAGGALVLVGTPIGNLGDLSPRAVQALTDADVVYCEDTRHSRKLLTHSGIVGASLRSLHEHNEDDRIDEVVAAVAGGATVVLVSDAGMPGVSDPGSRLVAAVAAAGLTVSVVPGPSAVLAALVTSGLPTDRFCFEASSPGRAGSAGSGWRRWPPSRAPPCSSRLRAGWPPPCATWRRPAAPSGRWRWPGS